MVVNPSTTDSSMHFGVAKRPFDVVSEKLKLLGSLSVSDFLNGPRSMDDYWEQTRASGVFNSDFEMALLDEDVADDDKPNPVLQIYETAQRVFGSSDHLSFEFIEIEPTCKQCILTITRTNGLSRSYRTDPIYSSKNDAKKAVSQMAVDKGAIDFIISGDSDLIKAKKGLLAPLDPATQSSKEEVIHVPSEDDAAAQQIEDCCAEWRAGRVKPHWVTFHDFRDTSKYGTALRINLTSNIARTFSVEPSYPSPALAKSACARLAIQQEVLDYIRHGNGQTVPLELSDINADDPALPSTRRMKLSLQALYESLPRPFPEDFGEKTASAINAPGWLNLMLQTAQGGGLRPSFYTFTDHARGAHGCVFRLEDFEGCQTYILDPCIGKRGDVKPAVCLLAASQRVGDHIRGIARQVDGRLTPQIRRTAIRVQNVISAELAQRHSHMKLRVYFDFTREREAHGCNMRIELAPPNPKLPPLIQIFKAPCRYRSKPDAKLGVCYLAAEQGAVELMRFRGQEPPLTYVPFIPTSRAYVALLSSKRTDDERKRKLQEEMDHEEHKKRKLEENGSDEKSLDKLRNDALCSLKVTKDIRRRTSVQLSNDALEPKPMVIDDLEVQASTSKPTKPNTEPHRHVSTAAPPRRTGSGLTITRFPPPPSSTTTYPAVPPPPVHLPQPPHAVHASPHPTGYVPHPQSPPLPPGYVIHPPGYPQPLIPPPQMYYPHYPGPAYAHNPPPPTSFAPTPYSSPYVYPHQSPPPVPPGHLPVYGTSPPPHSAYLPVSPPLLPAHLSPPSAPMQLIAASRPSSSSTPKNPARKMRSMSANTYQRASQRQDSDKWDHNGFQEHQDEEKEAARGKDDDVDALIKRATNYNDKQALLDYCQKQNLEEPLFFPLGQSLAVLVEKERFELPDAKVDPEKMEEAEQRLAKVVLRKLQVRSSMRYKGSKRHIS